MRIAEISRKTYETDVFVRINLDGSGKYKIDTGIGFIDHMLTHIAVHGLFDLEVKAQGDLEVDFHHTIEDCAIVLGQAIDKALENRQGIARMASVYTPMDEALAFVALDLSGRPYPVIQTEWRTPAIHGIPTSLFTHFFESLAINMRANLHARTLYGRDDHHQAEALFKALGRALCEATRIDQRRLGNIPSTKGTLA
jgi:imidazoleglycerol-phosphate dehydratase